MASVRSVNPDELRTAVMQVAGWLDGTAPQPPWPDVALAVRLTLHTLAAVAPGRSVEVRVPPFGVVQCVQGPQHKRGTPSNVVEMDAKTWLSLATGRLQWTEELNSGHIYASGIRSDLSEWLPIISETES